ncbi:MAG TPA: hypothetical protein VFT64_10220 [Rickettsiales bacterium]|nr:hypothetical protein [Rickettsiales bacterium]
MSHEYYIIHENGNQGPYDLVALVIKIRNGSLRAEMHVQRNDKSDAYPAQDWEELREFFIAKAEPEHVTKPEPGLKHHYTRKLSLLDALKGGINFLQQNQVSTLFSGLIILLILLGALGVSFMVPPEWRVPCYMIGFIMLHFLLSCYLLLILRMTRGQPMNLPYFAKRIKSRFLKMIRSSMLASFPVMIGFILFMQLENALVVSIIGLLIIIIPGIYTMTIYSFAPLLIADKDYNVWEAMETSRSAILKGGSENCGVYFSLNTINLIGGLFMLLPMAVTLPVTMSAICEFYDELFS